MTQLDPFSNDFSHLINRRQILKTANAGFGYLALASLLRETAPRTAAANSEAPANRPLAPRQPQFPVKAKRVIFLFMGHVTNGYVGIQTKTPGG